MQVARATLADIEHVFIVNNILEELKSKSVPESWLDENDDNYWFDENSDSQCAMAMRKLLEVVNIGALFRVTMGMSTLTDPANKIIDPDLDVLDYHPEIKTSISRVAELEAHKANLINVLESIYSISYKVSAYHQDHLGNRCECRKCVDQRAHDLLTKLTNT